MRCTTSWMIYQSGYLTIKDYDERFCIYALGFPNEEVEEGFSNFLLPYNSSMQSYSFWVRLLSCKHQRAVAYMVEAL